MAAGIIAQQPSPDLDPGAPPAMPAIAGAPSAPGAAAPPAAAPGAGPAPAPSQAPPNAIEQPPKQKGTITTGPDVKPEYDAKKLAKANTTLDLLNAMKPKSRTDYMDWWQTQHGNIDEKYDNLQKQLGKRPDADQELSTKEKFSQLLEFGLHLMKNSSAPGNQGAAATNAVADSVESVKAAQAQPQEDYDAQSNAIETARRRDQAAIGTPESAMKGQQVSDKDYASETRDNAAAFKDVNSALATKSTSFGATTYVTQPDGTLVSVRRDEDGKPVTEQVMGIDGKPLRGRQLGKAATDANGRPADTAAIRNQKYLQNTLGVDADTSAKIAFRVPSKDPAKDHLAVYRAVLAATMGDETKAKSAADQYVIENHGPKAFQGQMPPPLVPTQRPASDFAGMKAGMNRRFPDGSVYTLGIDGKPVPVSTH